MTHEEYAIDILKRIINEDTTLSGEALQQAKDALETLNYFVIEHTP